MEHIGTKMNTEANSERDFTSLTSYHSGWDILLSEGFYFKFYLANRSLSFPPKYCREGTILASGLAYGMVVRM